MEGLGSGAVLYRASKLLTSVLRLCLFALPVLRLGLLLSFRQLLLNGRFLRLHKLLCGKLLEGRCHNIQIPCLEENKEFDFYDLFTNDELYDMWLINNADWYANYANSPATAGKRPYTQARLLQDFLDKADNAIKTGENSAFLRFGHEVCVLPLACLMELGECGIEISNIDDIEKKWQNYWDKKQITEDIIGILKKISIFAPICLIKL